MTGRLVALAQMMRLGNALMAALAVVAGAALLSGPSTHWVSVGLAALAVLLGVGAGNLLNDVRDVEIDRAAHPQRALPQGRVTRAQAMTASVALFLVALAVAAAANRLVVAGAGILILLLVIYESAWKEQGLVGNFWISLVVASTFILGALAAPFPPFSYGAGLFAEVAQHPRIAVPFVVAFLAMMANTAREVFKDVEDAEADRGHRRTLPHRVGARGAMGLGRIILFFTLLFTVWGAFRHADLGARIVVDYVLLLPSIGLFSVALSRRDADAAQRWTKLGMAAAVLGFLIIGLL